MSSSAITGPILSDTRRAPSGTAAAPSFAFNDSTGTGVYLVSPGVLGLSTAGVQRVVVDASGNVGIGTSTPQARLDLGNASGERLRLYSAARIGFGVDMGGTFGNSAFTNHSFNWGLWDGTTWTERMRLDASGNLGVGGTPSEKLHVFNGVIEAKRDGGVGNNNYFRIHHAGSTIVNHAISSNTNYDIVNFSNGVRLTLSGNSWGAISDERKKKNIKPLEYGLAQINEINPVRFDYKTEESEDSNRLGFIAQQLAPIVKEAVQGSEETEYSVTPTDLIPVLVAAVKELSAKNEALEARLAALESK